MSQLPEDRKHSYFHNWISAVGGVFSVLFFSIILFFIAVDLFGKGPNLYVQGLAYCILPGFLIFSLLLIPAGALRERSQRVKRGGASRFPHIDFNDPSHRHKTLLALGILTLFVLFSVFGTYQAYRFSESVKFCGTMCHQLMEPEYTAYQKSPHAKVDCVQCHIGPGADWFVRSKLTGLYQVYATITHKYPKPVQTPIKNLRPAQETCEQCHWPKAFFGAVEQDKNYFLPDEKNTHWRTRMLVFVGGGDPPYGKREGIHWHMNIKNKIEYVATDPKRLEIPWVKKTGPDGKEEVFVTEGSDFSASKKPAGETRRLDCIDCHNRPSHQYQDPVHSVNESMSAGTIDPSLPYIKREAVKALLGKYASHEEADKQIETEIRNFYQKNYPAQVGALSEKINAAIRAIQNVYKTNFFPFMNVSWKQYPNHLGHMTSPGCFRCHDGKHKSAEGRVISHDCKVCHNIIAQGVAGAMETQVDGLEFKHPEDIGEDWKEMSCTDCHTGELV